MNEEMNNELHEAALSAWGANEDQARSEYVERINNKDVDENILWYLTHKKVQGFIDSGEFNIVDSWVGPMSSACYSVKSAMGHVVEELLSAYGNAVAARNAINPPEGRHLISYGTRHGMIIDGLSEFSDNSVVASEGKLSGDNDSKAVAKNLEALASVVPGLKFAHNKVETAIVLPFASAERLPKKWSKGVAPDHIVSGKDVWALLFGITITDDEYLAIVDYVAEKAALRFLEGYLTPRPPRAPKAPRVRKAATSKAPKVRQAKQASYAYTVRAWAKANGYSVAARGRISQEIQDAYLASQA